MLRNVAAGGTQCAIWRSKSPLRGGAVGATSRKVAGSIPDAVIGIFQ